MSHAPRTSHYLCYELFEWIPETQEWEPRYYAMDGVAGEDDSKPGMMDLYLKGKADPKVAGMKLVMIEWRGYEDNPTVLRNRSVPRCVTYDYTSTIAEFVRVKA